MMFYRALVLWLSLGSTAATAGVTEDARFVDGTPFGFREGMTTAQLEAFRLDGYRPGDVELYVVDPMDGLGGDTFYRVVVAPALGLCSVDALTPFDRESSVFEAEEEFNRRRSRIREVLGSERLTNRWRKHAVGRTSAARWGPDVDALESGNQHYSAIWQRGEVDGLPLELEAIEMGYETVKEFVFVRLRYEFRNVRDCRLELEKRSAEPALAGQPLGIRSGTSAEELRQRVLKDMVADGDTPFAWPLARSFGPSLPLAMAFHSKEAGACAVVALSDTRREAGDGRHSVAVFELYEAIVGAEFGPSTIEVGPVAGSPITSPELWVHALEEGAWTHSARWSQQTAAVLPAGVESVELSIVTNQQGVPMVRLAFRFETFDLCAKDAQAHLDDAL
jgi:hypothetical protein